MLTIISFHINIVFDTVFCAFSVASRCRVQRRVGQQLQPPRFFSRQATPPPMPPDAPPQRIFTSICMSRDAAFRRLTDRYQITSFSIDIGFTDSCH